MNKPNDLSEKELYVLQRFDKIEDKLDKLTNRVGFIYAYASAIGFIFSFLGVKFF